jgi:hypothetical protein
MEIYLTVLIWYCIGRVLNDYHQHPKITRNQVSALHALTTIAMTFSNVPIIVIFHNSRGYYMMDGIYEILDMPMLTQIKLYQLGMIFHHIVTFIGLQYLLDPIASHYIHQAFLLAEMSNLPMYVMKHMYMSGIKYYPLRVGVLFVEFLSYIYLRMYLCLLIIHQLFMDSEITGGVKTLSLSIYLISGIWTYKLCCQMVDVFKKC